MSNTFIECHHINLYSLPKIYISYVILRFNDHILHVFIAMYYIKYKIKRDTLTEHLCLLL